MFRRLRWPATQRLLLLITVAMVLFIFGNSLQPAAISGAQSGSITQGLNHWLASMGLSFTLPEVLIRKTGHLLEYSVLGILLCLNLLSMARRPLHSLGWSLFAGLLIPCLDETIQLFTPGRSGQVSDVLLDFGGILLGHLLMSTLYYFSRSRLF